LKTPNKELPALLGERASTPQKRGSEAKGGILERRVLIKLNARGAHWVFRAVSLGHGDGALFAAAGGLAILRANK
jgi:hypothetical protein